MALCVWEFCKILLLGLLEGVTEWLPISSTGHLLLLDEVIALRQSEAFKEVFFVVVQLGAVLAVVCRSGARLFPLERREKNFVWKKETLGLWGKIAVACVPGFLAVVFWDDFFDEHCHTPFFIALCLIVLGVVFLLPDRWILRGRPEKKIEEIGFGDAVWIGLFQALSIMPGTSRSGATILGARLRGVKRSDAAEFSFLLALPVMLGYSAWKLAFAPGSFTLAEWAAMMGGCAVSFITSLFVLEGLIRFLQRHSLRLFGWYRILLGVLILFLLH